MGRYRIGAGVRDHVHANSVAMKKHDTFTPSRSFQLRSKTLVTRCAIDSDLPDVSEASIVDLEDFHPLSKLRFHSWN